MSSQPTAGPAESAFDVVINSLVEGWNRMVWLLFKGPYASLSNWLWWGLILLLAGVAGGSGSGNFPSGPDDGDIARSSSWNGGGSTDAGSFFGAFGPIEAFAIAALVGFVILVAIALLYVRSRFRYVMLEGVLHGEPRIRGVWGRTANPGVQYFVWEMLVILAGLLMATPLLVMWLPIVIDAVRGAEPSAGPLVAAVFATLIYLVPLLLFFALLGWFVYDVVLPLTWRTGESFKSGLFHAGRLLKRRFGAMLLMFIGRFIVAIASAIAAVILVCCSCPIWGVPIALIVLLALVSVPFPPLFVLTLPLMFVLGVVTAWLMLTIQAPIYLFGRAWSYDFVRRLEPELGAWDEGPDRFAPPEPASPPPAPPAPTDPPQPPLS